MSSFNRENISENLKESPSKIRTLAMILATLIIGSVWFFTPLRRLSSPEFLTTWIHSVPADWKTFVIIQLTFAIGSVFYLPVAIIFLATALIFPFWSGLICSVVGCFLAGSTGFVVGRLFNLERLPVGRMAKRNRIIQQIRQQGGWAVLALRLAPTPPFAFTSMVSGALGLHFFSYILGTIVGIFPILLFTQIFGEQIVNILREPTTVALTGLAAALVFYLAFSLTKKRYLKSQGSQQ